MKLASYVLKGKMINSGIEAVFFCGFDGKIPQNITCKLCIPSKTQLASYERGES
jgi:hypothetical protein